MFSGLPALVLAVTASSCVCSNTRYLVLLWGLVENLILNVANIVTKMTRPGYTASGSEGA